MYFKTGLKLKEANLDALRCISDATDGGCKIAIVSGDFNIIAIDLQNSGMLEVVGLEIILPTNSDYTCTAGTSGGSVIDYPVITKQRASAAVWQPAKRFATSRVPHTLAYGLRFSPSTRT